MLKTKRFLVLSLLLCLGHLAPPPALAANEGLPTTLILVRHAEKAADGTLNPPLTELGEARAAELAYLLGHVELEAVYDGAPESLPEEQRKVRELMDRLGRAGSAHRAAVYASGLSGTAGAIRSELNGRQVRGGRGR